MSESNGSQVLTLEEAINQRDSLMEQYGVNSVYQAQRLPASANKDYLLVLMSLIERKALY